MLNKNCGATLNNVQIMPVKNIEIIQIQKMIKHVWFHKLFVG